MPNFDPRNKEEVDQARGNFGAAGNGRAGALGGDRGPFSAPPRGPFTRTMSPMYNLQDMRLSDLGITGALKAMIEGTITGNMWSGRTPIGFAESFSRDLGTANGLGNTGGRDVFGNQLGNRFRFRKPMTLQELLNMMQNNPLQQPTQPTKVNNIAVDPAASFARTVWRLP